MQTELRNGKLQLVSVNDQYSIFLHTCVQYDTIVNKFIFKMAAVAMVTEWSYYMNLELTAY